MLFIWQCLVKQYQLILVKDGIGALLSRIDTICSRINEKRLNLLRENTQQDYQTVISSGNSMTTLAQCLASGYYDYDCDCDPDSTTNKGDVTFDRIIADLSVLLMSHQKLVLYY